VNFTIQAGIIIYSTPKDIEFTSHDTPAGSLLAEIYNGLGMN
jgi:hypothetical protein